MHTYLNCASNISTSPVSQTVSDVLAQGCKSSDLGTAWVDRLDLVQACQSHEMRCAAMAGFFCPRLCLHTHNVLIAAGLVEAADLWLPWLQHDHEGEEAEVVRHSPALCAK
eukprot:scaffold366527_cov39-Prasinocladus_malaysianus.AAC.1